MFDDRDDDDKDYEVGFGKPPKGSRFKKGQSGNPKGRPRGSQNLATLLDKLMDTDILVSSGGKQQKLTRQEAMLLSQINKAMKGDTRAFNALMKLRMDVTPKPEKTAPKQEAIQAPPQMQKSGVLVVPADMTVDEWIAKYPNGLPDPKEEALKRIALEALEEDESS